jgi:hypothetical protein
MARWDAYSYPNVQLDIIVDKIALDIESDGRHSGHGLVELELVERC